MRERRGERGGGGRRGKGGGRGEDSLFTIINTRQCI